MAIDAVPQVPPSLGSRPRIQAPRELNKRLFLAEINACHGSVLGTVDHLYRYANPSSLVREQAGIRVQVHTSGGAAEFPYFFQGALRRPRQTAQLLRVLSNVVRSRFHLPPAMLKKIIATRDPVVTSGGGLLRFEGFSACCGVYARVDLAPDAYDGVVVGQGTTNVDFNTGFCSALSQIRDDERVGLAVGADEVSLLRGAGQLVERKVKLPLRWLKGLVEVQICQARMTPRFSLNKIAALRFMRAIPRGGDSRASHFIGPSAGGGLRWSHSPLPDSIELRGVERLRVLDQLAPWADSMTIHADPTSGACAFLLGFGPLSFHLVLSPETWRGFSGEGQALEDLAGEESDQLVPRIHDRIRRRAVFRTEDLADDARVPARLVRHALARLGARGFVGYDLARSEYFQRELPFDLSALAELHPRLRDARRLASEGRVTILRQTVADIDAEVTGGDVAHRINLTNLGDSCTCPWYAKHQGRRGPCKHVLAARLFTRTENDSD